MAVTVNKNNLELNIDVGMNLDFKIKASYFPNIMFCEFTEDLKNICLVMFDFSLIIINLTLQCIPNHFVLAQRIDYLVQ